MYRRVRHNYATERVQAALVLPEIIPKELYGTDEKVGENDWICYYENAEQSRALILSFLGKDSTQKP